jgi:hypothetical protein
MKKPDQTLRDIMEISNELIQILKESVNNDNLILGRRRFNYVYNKLVKINNIAHEKTVEMGRQANI